MGTIDKQSDFYNFYFFVKKVQINKYSFNNGCHDHDHDHIHFHDHVHVHNYFYDHVCGQNHDYDHVHTRCFGLYANTLNIDY